MLSGCWYCCCRRWFRTYQKVDIKTLPIFSNCKCAVHINSLCLTRLPICVESVCRWFGNMHTRRKNNFTKNQRYNAEKHERKKNEKIKSSITKTKTKTCILFENAHSWWLSLALFFFLYLSFSLKYICLNILVSYRVASSLLAGRAAADDDCGKFYTASAYSSVLDWYACLCISV